MSAPAEPPLGATPDRHGGCTFTVWAPARRRVDVVLSADGPDATPRVVPMLRADRGYFTAHVADVPLGARYRYRLDGDLQRPDPASRAQPDGVHGPSAVVAHAPPRPLAPDWRGRPLRDYVIYELHVGTFTPAGTFDAAIAHLADLADLGVTAVEPLPVAQFPGARNWGYDGVYPYAAQDSYGGRAGFARFVDACHAHGLAVVLDVVYNHLGPEGNYIAAFGPYFTDRYRTPWGDAVNVDGPGSDEVRRYLVDNAVEWIEALGVDALRLDAVHAIVDPTPRPFLAELVAAVHAAGARAGRLVHVIAESDANDRRVLTAPADGGLGFDGVWADDFHHALHVWLSAESAGYYADYGGAEPLARALRDGWVYTGQRSAFRDRRHGSSPRGIPAQGFVVCAQNHDQVGNRMRGDRLTTLVGPERARLATAAALLSPFTPLLFMGEEHGETRPFPYFVSHGDPALVAAVRAGRAEEFAALNADPGPPDPASPDTFAAAVLDRAAPGADDHRALVRALLALRREAITPLGPDPARDVAVLGPSALLLVYRTPDGAPHLAVLLYAAAPAGPVSLVLPPGDWALALDTRLPRPADDRLPARLAGGRATEITPDGPVAAAWRRVAPSPGKPR